MSWSGRDFNGIILTGRPAKAVGFFSGYAGIVGMVVSWMQAVYKGVRVRRCCLCMYILFFRVSCVVVRRWSQGYCTLPDIGVIGC